MRIVVLLGPPGCGKGTQSDILEEKFQIKKLSTGDMLRTMAAEKNDLGAEIKSVMASGKLVSDELIIKVIKGRIAKDDCLNGFILDGFPRTTAQAKALDEMIEADEKLSNASLSIFEFQLDHELLVERVTGRFSCKQCLMGYHDTYKRPKQEGVCDRCGSTEFVRRPDDNEDTVRARLKTYNDETFPIILYYKNGDRLQKINADQEMEVVYEEIKEKLLD